MKWRKPVFPSSCYLSGPPGCYWFVWLGSVFWLICGLLSDLLCVSRGVWMVWQEVHSTVGFFPPWVCHLLPCTKCISACIPSGWCKPSYLLVFTEPMGNAWLLAIPDSGCLWCSFPLSYQHLHLLPSPVGNKHQQTSLNSSASTSNTPENNSTVFFPREVRMSAVFQASSWGVRYC